jgi:LysM repeat protein
MMSLRLLAASAIFLATLVLSTAPIGAQDENLLTNPGFEEAFVQVEGEQPFYVAEDWEAWHTVRIDGMPSFQNAQPLFISASEAPSIGITPRIRSGSNAQIYYSYFETHDGGLFQQISGLTPGLQYRFSVYAYIWSSTFEDESISEDPGDVAFRVGIDPNGGTDPDESTVTYSTPAVFYDAYREYSIIATAQSETITVFVRSTVGIPVQNSTIYLDDAVLELATPSIVPTVTGAATATTNPTEVNPTSTATTVVVAPVETQVPSTDTPLPATDTAIPVTSTDLPATMTDVPPTATDAPPTATDVPPTATDVPPTATDVPPTATDVPPTATDVPPTATPTTILEATPTQEIGLVSPTSPPPASSATPTIPGGFLGTINHTVRQADTVASIAALYGSTEVAIRAANNLAEDLYIFAGQRLVVPVPLPNPVLITPTIQVITVTPSPVVASTPLPVATPVPPIDPTIITQPYVVQRGDSLWLIANRYGTTIDTLVKLNGIANPNRIQVGQVIQVPVPEGSFTPTATPVAPQPQQFYVVRPGDTLFSIAIRFNVSMLALAEANGISNFNLIFAGQTLIIP